jgi:PAS domain S-box-containing protein
MSEAAAKPPSSQLIGHLLDAVEDVVYVIDADGNSAFWNERLERTTGYSSAEIADMPPKEFLPPEQREHTPGLGAAIEALGDSRVVLDLVTKDGERIPHEFRGTTIEDPASGEVYRCGIARDVSEREARKRELERYETIVETVSDGVYALDADLAFDFVNEGLCDLLGRDRSALMGTTATELFEITADVEEAAAIREWVQEGDRDVGTIEATAERPDGAAIETEARYRLHPAPEDGEYRGSVGVVRDVTERNRRERELAHQRDELATLTRIADLLLDITRDLVETGSREAVERTVCERLAASDLYGSAWIGEPAFDGDGLIPRASAGGDAIETGVEIDAGGEPVATALSEDELRVDDVSDATGDVWDPVVETDDSRVAAVPLAHEGAVYGVLGVTAPREAAFEDEERAGIDTLGDTVGFVINALKRRDLLFADSAVELTFDIDTTRSALARVAAALDCELTLDGSVAVGDRWLVYIDVADAEPDAVVDRLRREPKVGRTRVVADQGDRRRIELRLAESPLLAAATSGGGSLRSATVVDDRSRFVLEVPAAADVRETVALVQSVVSDASLVARSERDRRPATPEAPGGVLAGLTDRQGEALAVAYRAGYFEWPRDSTAEEVAEALDVSPPTLHAHLRKAQNTLLSSLLEPTADHPTD